MTSFKKQDAINILLEDLENTQDTSWAHVNEWLGEQPGVENLSDDEFDRYAEELEVEIDAMVEKLIALIKSGKI